MVFIGSTLPPQDLPQFPAASDAGNLYQFGLLSACARRRPNAVRALTIAPHRMWRGKGGKLASGAWRITTPDTLEIRSVPYINVLLAKQVSIAFALLLSTVIWGWERRHVANRTVMVYNTISYMAVPARIGAVLTRSQFVPLVADVPDAGHDHWFLWRRLTQLDNAVRWRMMRHSDRMICLAERTGRDFGGDRPFLVVEAGISDTSSPLPRPEKRPLPRHAVHAGSLGYLSGIELALEAFDRVRTPGAQFHIYGAGPQANRVEEAAQRDPERIVFHGRVPHATALEAVRSARLLLCPRLPDGEVTPYTFPSKLYEYLASGVPVLCNALEGIPSESVEYFNIPDEPTPEAWAAAIERGLCDSDGALAARGSAGAAFVHAHKNWDSQAERVMRFLEAEHSDANEPS